MAGMNMSSVALLVIVCVGIAMYLVYWYQNGQPTYLGNKNIVETQEVDPAELPNQQLLWARYDMMNTNKFLETTSKHAAGEQHGRANVTPTWGGGFLTSEQVPDNYVELPSSIFLNMADGVYWLISMWMQIRSIENGTTDARRRFLSVSRVNVYKQDGTVGPTAEAFYMTAAYTSSQGYRIYPFDGRGIKAGTMGVSFNPNDPPFMLTIVCDGKTTISKPGTISAVLRRGGWFLYKNDTFITYYEIGNLITSSLWDGHVVLSTGVSDPNRTIMPNSTLDASWHTLTVYTEACTAGQNKNLYLLSKRRFTVQWMGQW